MILWGLFLIVISITLEITSWFSMVYSKSLALWVMRWRFCQLLGEICLVSFWQIQWNASVKTSQLIFHLWMNRKHPIAKEGQVLCLTGACWLLGLHHYWAHSGLHTQFTNVCAVSWQGDLSLTTPCHFSWGPLQWGKVQGSWPKLKQTFYQLTIAFSGSWLFPRSFGFSFRSLPLTPPVLFRARVFSQKIAVLTYTGLDWLACFV